MKIFGLKLGQVFNTLEDVHKQLRYGRIVIITDQDLDGLHIKGLFINVIDCCWPSLLKIEGFIEYMNTPIVTATKITNKNSQVQTFYYNQEYLDAAKLHNNFIGWNIKYYKGLGTSVASEFKQYFKTPKSFKTLTHSGIVSSTAIDMAFNKKKSDERKTWLSTYLNKEAKLIQDNVIQDNVIESNKISIENFIDQELILFSVYDNIRSIPNIMDGLKPSQRKVMFSVYKRNLVKEIKVSQLSGYVSEHSAYHHGEKSLEGTIVGMSQQFVGSNNINMLVPSGQFGTRVLGGKDSASPRYIFTKLESITSIIFNKDDTPILRHLYDDGELIEPEYYIPIIPTVLLNGSSGIGTGWSTDMLCYHPPTIVNYIRQYILTGEFDRSIEFTPYYEGFKGTITPIHNINNTLPNKYLVKGAYQIISDSSILITELPIGTWTQSYYTMLEQLSVVDKSVIDKSAIDKNEIKVPLLTGYSIETKNQTVEIRILINFNTKHPLFNGTNNTNNTNTSTLKRLELETKDGINGIESLLKLTTTINSSNMHLFDVNGKLNKYNTVYDIINEFIAVRLDAYNKRKESILISYQHKLVKLFNRAKFVSELVNKTIILSGKTGIEIDLILEQKSYVRLSNKISNKEEDDDNINNNEDTNITDTNYKYLTKMSCDSVNIENVNKIIKEYDDLVCVIDTIKNTTPQQMWTNDLDKFNIEYDKYKIVRENLQLGIDSNNQVNNNNSLVTKVKSLVSKVKNNTKKT